MSIPLPPVAALVLADAVDALSARLRKRLDEMVVKAAGWPVTSQDNLILVRVDDATTVTLAPAAGVIRSGDAVRCDCLLAPACLHRVAVLSRAPVDDGEPAGDSASTGDNPGTGDSASPADSASPDGGQVGSGQVGGGQVGSAQAGAGGAGGPGQVLTPAQHAAADGLWRAGVAVLEAGVTGCGVVLRTGLLRATHEARAVGLYRAAAAGRALAARLQAAREAAPQYRLADLTDELRELLTVTHRLRRSGPPDASAAGWVGTARRGYDVQGSLRLYGLCTVPVVAESGYAGVLTYLVDRAGKIWSIADIYPGGVDRAVGAAGATVALGEAALSHRALTRAGLVVSGATASASGQLGAGRTVRAVRAAGAGWDEDPLAPLWQEPFADQLSRSFAALALPVGDRTAGSDLLFLRVELAGWSGGDVPAVAEDGTRLTLGAALPHTALPYLDNLRVLGAAPGLRLALIGRPDPTRRGRVLALAVASPAGADALVLAEGAAQHVDLGYDRLHRSNLPAGLHQAGPLEGRSVTGDPATGGGATGDPALGLLRRQLERVVDGGRAVQALAASPEHRLRRVGLTTGADLIAALAAESRSRTRDAFGRLAVDDGHGFASAWLAAALYDQAATAAYTEAAWR